MKAFVAFSQLPLQKQARTLWEEGNYLLSRRVGGYSFSLYALENFFVEVCYDERLVPTQVIILDSFIRLDAYLKVISLKRLFA